MTNLLEITEKERLSREDAAARLHALADALARHNDVEFDRGACSSRYACLTRWSSSSKSVAVGDVLPALRLPLRAAAAIVAFSRVYTGVHYPGDVLVGATVGTLAGRLTSAVARRISRRSAVARRSSLGVPDTPQS